MRSSAKRMKEEKKCSRRKMHLPHFWQCSAHSSLSARLHRTRRGCPSRGCPLPLLSHPFLHSQPGNSLSQWKGLFRHKRALLILFVRIKSNLKFFFNSIRMMSLHATILIRLILLGKCNQEDGGIVRGSLSLKKYWLAFKAFRWRYIEL